jgi:hypothetical protein
MGRLQSSLSTMSFISCVDVESEEKVDDYYIRILARSRRKSGKIDLYFKQLINNRLKVFGSCRFRALFFQEW